jgi:uncharacterized protein involved in outer membrane biogenesis
MKKLSLAAGFITLWCFFMCIIFVVALIANVDWSRSRLERLMAQTLNRPVVLGPLNLTLGLDGFAIDTTRLRVSERNGSPFLNAGHSEIGVALWPLFSGRLKIRHLEVDKPEVWIVKNQKGEWNFADLLKNAIDVNFVETTNGIVHLIALPAKNGAIAFPATDLKDFDAKFVRPSKRVNRPFLLSFDMPRPKGTSRFEINGLGLGRTKDWLENPCVVKVHATDVDLDELRLADAILDADLTPARAPLENHQVEGQFSFDGKFEGIFNKDFKASFDGHASSFKCYSESLGDLKATNVELKLNIDASKDQLAWHNSLIRVPQPGVDVSTEGVINNWHDGKRAVYDGSVLGVFSDLEALSGSISLSKTLPDKRQLSLSQLKGNAFVDLKFENKTGKPKISSDLRLAGVEVKNLLATLPNELVSAACLLNLSDSSKFSGDLSVNTDNKASFDDCTIDSGKVKYKVEGNADLNNKTSNIKFSGREIPLDDLSKQLDSSRDLQTALLQTFHLKTEGNISLGGKADLDCAVEQNADSLKVNADATLNDAKIVVKKPQLSYEGLKGRVKISPQELRLENISGTMGGSKVNVAGVLGPGTNGKINIHLDATHFNLGNIENLLTLVGDDSTIFKNDQLRGTVRDIDLDVTGTRLKPIISFVATPEELFYQPEGLAKALKATSGTIRMENDNLSLRDVNFNLASGNVLTNFDLKHLSVNPQLEKIHLKTTGLDLKESDYYLSSTLAPTSVRKALAQIKGQYKLAPILKGRISGDVGCKFSGEGAQEKASLEGLLAVQGFDTRFGENKIPLEHLTGVFELAGDDLSAHGLSGVIGRSQFELDGKATTKHDQVVGWKGELKAIIEPEDLGQTAAIVFENLKDYKLSAKTPVSVRFRGSGQKDSASANFSVSAASEARLTIKTENGVFRQPANRALQFDSNFKSDGDQLQLNEGKLSIGSDLILLKGTAKSGGRLKDVDGARVDPELSVSVRIPAFVSVGTFFEAFDPSTKPSDITGRMKGSFKFKGAGKDHKLIGNISFEGVSLAALALSNLKGDLSNEGLEEEEESKDALRLRLQELSLENLHLKEIVTHLNVASSTGKLHDGVITIKDFHGTLGGGKVTARGMYDLQNHKLALDSTLKGASAANLLEEIIGLKGELTGVVEAETKIESEGMTRKEIQSNLSGRGAIVVRDGSVSRFGRLQAKLNQVNLLHQGLFGFNLNNLMQSMVPVRSGDFHEITSSWQLASGVLSIDELRYSGDDMRLWAAGRANLPLHTIELDIAGQIPRVPSSVLSGTVGDISREFTVQKMMNSITLHKLESLPSLPVLGEIASDKPRVFTFKILAPYDQPRTISQSIEKSFHWLQSKPNATAHPIPGIASN